MNRTVEPEILDDLPPDDPAAVRSRRDLRMINALMGGQRWIVRQLRDLGKVRRIVELGAGDGDLSQQLKSHFPHSEVVAVDLIPRPASVPNEVIWHQGNVLEYDGFDQESIVIANLFIHHLQEDELRLLGKQLSGARAIILAEPHRKTSAIGMGYMIFPLINHVTRHDMITSIKAGFLKGELEDLLGEEFHWKEEVGLLGGIRMVGVKR